MPPPYPPPRRLIKHRPPRVLTAKNTKKSIGQKKRSSSPSPSQGLSGEGLGEVERGRAAKVLRPGIWWTFRIIQVMTDVGKPHPLDYRRLPKGRVRYVESAEEKRWRYFRILFRIGVTAIVAPLAIHFGVNYFMFGNARGLSMDYFIPFAQRCVPAVRAMKEYQRDTGHLPQTLDDLQPTYIPKDDWIPGSIFQGQFSSIAGYNHVINYDFTPGSEHFEVSGPLVSGRIPFPPVAVGPTTTPWVQP
jgi:hypothetical protein